MNTEERLRELRDDVWALMEFLGVKVVTYKEGKTGNPDSPFTFGRGVVRIEDINKKK